MPIGSKMKVFQDRGKVVVVISQPDWIRLLEGRTSYPFSAQNTRSSDWIYAQRPPRTPRWKVRREPRKSPPSTKSSTVGVLSILEPLEVIEKVGRGEWIRTTDLLVPNHQPT